MNDKRCVKCTEGIYLAKEVFTLLLGICITLYSIYISEEFVIEVILETENIDKVISSNLMKILFTHLQLLSILFYFPINLP